MVWLKSERFHTPVHSATHWDEFDSLDLKCLGCFEVGLLVSHKRQRPLPYVCSLGRLLVLQPKWQSQELIPACETSDSSSKTATTLEVDWVACYGCRIVKQQNPCPPFSVVLVAQLVPRHSCVADRLPWWFDSPLVRE